MTDHLKRIVERFDARIDRGAVISRGQAAEAATAAYELARALEFYGGASSITGDALNAYWRAVEADV